MVAEDNGASECAGRGIGRPRQHRCNPQGYRREGVPVFCWFSFLPVSKNEEQASGKACFTRRWQLELNQQLSNYQFDELPLLYACRLHLLLALRWSCEESNLYLLVCLHGWVGMRPEIVSVILFAFSK